MGQITNFRIVAETDASGDFEGVTAMPVAGKVVAVVYTPDPDAPLDGAAAIALTCKQSGVAIADHGSLGTEAFSRAYRQPVYQADGSAALYATGGEPVLAPFALAGELLQLVVSDGGDRTKGTFDVLVDVG